MISFNNVRIGEGVTELLNKLKDQVESKLNLHQQRNQKPVTVSQNMLLRIALIAGLAQSTERKPEDWDDIKFNSTIGTIHDTVFYRGNLQHQFAAVLKLRHAKSGLDFDNATAVRKAINSEIIRGIEFLSTQDNLDHWLLSTQSPSRNVSLGTIPRLNLHIGSYEGEINANIDLNGVNVSNSQIIIAGTTGSGKSNLLAVLINEIRSMSVETSYPVNFLLFDYKGEFSDPMNRNWLNLFEVSATAIFDPIVHPLPFNPFKDFTGRPQNEINLYSTELANALLAIDNTRISANMGNRLSEAIIIGYRITKNMPISFEIILKQYQVLKGDGNDDSVQSVLKQLIRTKLFETSDKVDLIKESFIVKMDGFPKDGPIAKAIVYFIVSKLNSLYEKLTRQATNDECVELRHFTIIDEAHYMLGFDNKPLRDLIAVGRNKGLSIILATQNMDSYKSDHFDFFANAQYPLIMKQQSMNDGVIKDLFGVSGKDFQEIKEAIAGLGKGELIIKDSTAIALGMGKRFKKIKVRHLI